MAAQFSFTNQTFKNIRFYNSQYIDVEKHALYCDPANCFEEECRQKCCESFDWAPQPDFSSCRQDLSDLG